MRYRMCGENVADISLNIPSCDCVGCANQLCETCISHKIHHYFHLGYPYQAMLGFLRKDGVSISLSTLKRRLRELRLSRRRHEIDLETVTRRIREEIAVAGRLAGYCSIWHALRIRHGLHVPRNLVAQILKNIDPAGV